MKKLNLQTSRILKVGLIVVMVAFFSSCESWIDPEINVDPTSPADVPMSLLIPTIQLDMGYNNMGNDVVRTTSIWMQMYDGVARQSFTMARYQLTSADINNLWGSIYTTQLMNAKILIAKAEEQQSPYNAAVGQILTALALGHSTDLWGSIPYSDALKGDENVLKATFDSQEAIYNSIFALLDQAIVNLNVDPADNLIDIEGDVYYDGDPDAWLAAAHSIKARHKLQLSKKNGNTAYTEALAAAANGFASNGGQMDCPFFASNKNPLFQFMEQRSGDLVMCATLLNDMGAADPRVPFYYAEDGDGAYTGSEPGSENDAVSLPGSNLAAATASTHLMTYAELKFIEAECEFVVGSKDNAAAAYIAAVTASIHNVTHAANTDWLTANVDGENGASITLDKIMMQKRIALVGQLQPFNDWRRTGIPSLSLAAGATLTSIPQRFPYSQDEGIYNPENVPVISDIAQKVWWAQ